jgi:hypothetical protein
MFANRLRKLCDVIESPRHSMMTALIMNADATAPIQYQTLFGKTFRKILNRSL